jgi:GNAT superfamily N-acetyltransferase
LLVEDHFVAKVRSMQPGGFRLAFLEDDAEIRVVAGFRLIEYLRGRVFYVDDLVTDEALRSKSYGRQMLLWLIAQARAEGCECFELDSGVQRFDTHRFYLSNRMIISGHHFRLKL